ncbi:hypothetical protein L5515_009723 [Caenorhabditis briggsae]|uniref:Uncharacterized protein n=1 Tax=Caenorhabditis briggsae TaxID=6238 RepID=A0AAE9F4V0_CAEBR|nr:hypothetical protein L5515_009723 [Caenorhabditis briggsae]
MANVVKQKTLADFWFSGDMENEEDKIHHLALEILKKRINFDDDENVKIYLEANHGKSIKSHPNRLKNGNSEIF